MSDGMGREPAYLSSHATNRYFIPNWGKGTKKSLYKGLVEENIPFLFVRNRIAK